MNMKEIIYIPTDLEKANIECLCNDIINKLRHLKTEEIAFTLNMLISSFEETYDVKFTSITSHSEKSEKVRK